jgi:hypothetical protein
MVKDYFIMKDIPGKAVYANDFHLRNKGKSVQQKKKYLCLPIEFPLSEMHMYESATSAIHTDITTPVS